MNRSHIVVKAPGRVCLFGEHLDYLGLFVISAAIDLYITISGSRGKNRILHILLPDIGEEEWIDLDQPIEYRKRRDYLRSAVKVLHRHGVHFDHGCDCTLTGTIPIQAGVSSSSALVIAWITFLLLLENCPEVNDRALIAKLGYEAEVREFDEPGGMMDHFTSSLGGVLWIDCKTPFSVEAIHGSPLQGFVLGDSLEKKPTTQVLASVKDDLQNGAQMLRQYLPSFDFRASALREVEPHLHNLPPLIQRQLRATLIDRDLALNAKKLLQSQPEDFDSQLGSLLKHHHEQLR
ncbi:MAG: galactokinase family protein, partial [Bacteroidota bacterium]